jgi:hypothetical protein
MRQARINETFSKKLATSDNTLEGLVKKFGCISSSFKSQVWALIKL